MTTAQTRAQVDDVVDYARGFDASLRRVERLHARRRARRDLFGDSMRWTGVLVLCAIILTGLIMFMLGYRTYAITGGSMEGTIHKGALSVAQIVPVAELRLGDVITYQPPGRGDLVTHRIVSIDTQADGRLLFQTKGDANASVDPWKFTLDSEVQVRYVFQVPYLGYALLMLGTPLVRTILLAGLALLLTATLFLRLWRQAGEISGDPEAQPEGEPEGVQQSRPHNGAGTGALRRISTRFPHAATSTLTPFAVAGPRRRPR